MTIRQLKTGVCISFKYNDLIVLIQMASVTKIDVRKSSLQPALFNNDNINNNIDIENILQFLNDASTTIKRALYTPAKCKRKVNHRKYFQKQLKKATVSDCSVGSTINVNKMAKTRTMLKTVRREASRNGLQRKSLAQLFSLRATADHQCHKNNRTKKDESTLLKNRKLPLSFFVEPCVRLDGKSHESETFSDFSNQLSTYLPFSDTTHSEHCPQFQQESDSSSSTLPSDTLDTLFGQADFTDWFSCQQWKIRDANPMLFNGSVGTCSPHSTIDFSESFSSPSPGSSSSSPTPLRNSYWSNTLSCRPRNVCSDETSKNMYVGNMSPSIALGNCKLTGQNFANTNIDNYYQFQHEQPVEYFQETHTYQDNYMDDSQSTDIADNHTGHLKKCTNSQFNSSTCTYSHQEHDSLTDCFSINGQFLTTFGSTNHCLGSYNSTATNDLTLHQSFISDQRGFRRETRCQNSTFSPNVCLDYPQTLDNHELHNVTTHLNYDSKDTELLFFQHNC